jgi:hypothetical protein
LDDLCLTGKKFAASVRTRPKKIKMNESHGLAPWPLALFKSFQKIFAQNPTGCEDGPK